MHIFSLILVIVFFGIIIGVTFIPQQPITTRSDIAELLDPKAYVHESQASYLIRKQALLEEFNQSIGNPKYRAGTIILEQYDPTSHLGYVKINWQYWTKSLVGWSEKGVFSLLPDQAQSIWQQGMQYPFYVQVNNNLHIQKIQFFALGHAWPIASAGLWKSAELEYRTIKSHKEKVVDIQFNTLGDVLISASADGVAKQRDTKDWKISNILEHDNPLSVLSLSNDGFVTVSLDGTLYFWSFKGKVLHTAYEDNIVRSIAFSKDQQMYATAGSDTNIRIHNATTGQRVQLLQGHTDWIRDLVFTHDHQHIISVSDDQILKVWSIVSGKAIKSINAHDGSILHLALDNEGRMLATASADGSAKIWSLPALQEIQVLTHSDWVRTVGFSKDSSIVFTGSDDGSVMLWQSQTGELLQTLKIEQPVYSLAMSVDMQTLVVGDKKGSLHIWSIKK